jgi:hypothetical protein
VATAETVEILRDDLDVARGHAELVTDESRERGLLTPLSQLRLSVHFPVG